jgi:hypothetical protein
MVMVANTKYRWVYVEVYGETVERWRLPDWEPVCSHGDLSENRALGVEKGSFLRRRPISNVRTA